MAQIDKYSKEELLLIIEHSESQMDQYRKLGYGTMTGGNRKTVIRRLQEQGIDQKIQNRIKKTKPITYKDEDIFSQDSLVSQRCVRNHYLKSQYTPYQCSICGLLPVWNQKPLTLILDHINGINNDNRLNNQRWVCPNCNQQQDTTGFKKIRTQPKKRYYCKICGKELFNKMIYCPNCRSTITQQRKETYQLDRPSREELKEFIRIIPFTKLGIMYGVSDNAIRKWCKRYQLPFRSRQIHQYSDEEWIKI